MKIYDQTIVIALLDGKKIKRQSGNTLIRMNDTEVTSNALTLEDKLADDWEVVE